MLVERLRRWRPEAVICDRFRLAELQAAAGGSRRLVPRVTRWSEASEDVRALPQSAADGPLAVENTDLRNTERIPLTGEGGIEAFLRREVLPYAAHAWYRPDRVKVGYEISFTRYFYKPKPMRTLAEIRADILALEQETEGLLAEILNVGEKRETTA